MSFWSQIKSIFNQAEASSAVAPTIHEMIERTAEDEVAYAQWKRTSGPKRLLDWLTNQYGRHLDGLPTDDTVGFLTTPSSKGFVVHFREMNYGKAEISHFFDYLRERVLTLNYRPDISDRRIFPRRDWIETQERHYLKPRIDLNADKIDQGFGNIMIEFELRNDVPHNLRLRATVYQDSLYKDGANFGGLMEVLAATT